VNANLPLIAVSVSGLLFGGRVMAAEIEQSVAGIRVGDRLEIALRLFPDLRMTGGDGVWTVPVGRNCTLEIVTSDNADQRRRIEVLTLHRIDARDTGADPNCDASRMGAGLRFGARLRELQMVYKPISIAEPGKDPLLYRKENGRECLTGRSSELRSMFVYWSTKSNRIETISVSASRLGCEEYRDTERERTGKE
jgi:hypothetical protein